MNWKREKVYGFYKYAAYKGGERKPWTIGRELHWELHRWGCLVHRFARLRDAKAAAEYLEEHGI